MEIVDLLFYKIDPVTGVKRIGKTKTISVILFIIFFLSFLSIYSTTLNLQYGLGPSIIGSLIAALMFVLPIAFIGWLIGKAFTQNKPYNNQMQYNQQYNYTQNTQKPYDNQTSYNNQMQYNQQYNTSQNTQNTYQENYYQNQNFNTQDNNYSNNQTNTSYENNTLESTKNYAEEFKNAVENNNGDNAAKILYNWEIQDKNDANYYYARIIFDGMPPHNTDLIELKSCMKIADKKDAKDITLREWFHSTAEQVINLNE